MRQRVTGTQNISRYCMVCGTDNPWGLKAQFLELENGELATIMHTDEYYQSYPGRLHGGISSMVLDETIGRAITIADERMWGVTIDLQMRYRRPVPLNEDVLVIGRITKETNRGFEGGGQIVLRDGTVAVEATGRYLKLPVEKIAPETNFVHSEWFADPRTPPTYLDW